MKNGLILVMVALCLCAPPPAASGEEKIEIIEQTGSGRINWTRGLLQAYGTQTPENDQSSNSQNQQDTFDKAFGIARQHLLALINEVRITSGTCVGDAVARTPALTENLGMMADNAQIISKEYLSDGTVAVTLQMNLHGGFTQLVLPQDIKQVEPIKAVGPAEAPAATVAAPVGAPDPSVDSETYTGLVVDARGIGVKPAMIPLILDEKGEEVYGPAFVSREFAVQEGMSGYASGLKIAQDATRVAPNPLTVKGLRTPSQIPTAIVISHSDAAKIRSTSENLSFLKECRVIIVVD